MNRNDLVAIPGTRRDDGLNIQPGGRSIYRRRAAVPEVVALPVADGHHAHPAWAQTSTRIP
jgi:hypothetical protein